MGSSPTQSTMTYLDKQKEKEYKKSWYLKNKKSILEKSLINNQIYRKRNQEFIREYKKKYSCLDCGLFFHFSAMDFDHITEDKEWGIARMVNNAYSLETIKKEIAKCELVCANCHRVRTYNRWRNRKTQ